MKTTCAECGFTLFDGDPRVLTEFGWAHPSCIAEGSSWEPKSW